MERFGQMALEQIERLSLEERKQAILRMSQFVLRESSANVRDSVYRRLLEIGLYLSEKKEKRELQGVLNSIEDQFFGIKLEEHVAGEYLKLMEKEGIVRHEGGKYTLDEKRKVQFENYSKSTLALISSCETSFIENVKHRVNKELTAKDVDNVTSCFYQFVIKLISRYILATAKFLVKGLLSRISPSTGENLVDSLVNQISDLNLREATKKTLLEWMQSPDDKFIEYLFVMRQNFLCIEVLNLDPECRFVAREEFSKKRLFLDTNILLSLVAKTEFHTQTRKLIENTRLLGCSVHVTKRTLEEFRMLTEKAKSILATLKATPQLLSNASNAIIRAYGKALLSGSSISQSEYMGELSDVVSMLDAIGVKVFDEEHEEIKELLEYSGLVEEVSKCFVKMRNRPKTVDVAQHDAFHLLLIKTLRESEVDSVMGPNVWFLSSDLTLSCAERFVNRKFDFSNRTSAVMVAPIWNEIIAPFLIGIVTQKDMVEVLKSFVSSEFIPISEGIDAETLARLEIDWAEYDWLEVEEIQEITKKRFVLQYISRREELAKTGDNEAIEQLRSEFNIFFSSLIGQISSRKIEQVKAELKQKEMETESLKVSVKNLEETKGRLGEDLNSEKKLSLAMRYIAGLSGLVLLAIGIGLIILMKETASWQIVSAYTISLIIGGLLLLMAIKPEQISGWIGLGQKK